MTHLARVQYQGRVRLGIAVESSIRLLTEGALSVDQGSPLGIAALAAVGWQDDMPFPAGRAIDRNDVVVLAPVPRPPKIICIGLNYRRHAAEGGVAVPEWPVVFAKFANAIADPDADVEIPEPDVDVDYEVELCVVIGRRARALKPGDGLAVVAGYTVANDVSARRWQLRVSQWTSGKVSDGFCPLGDVVATPGSIGDPQGLHLWTFLNGTRVQDSSTADMVFGVDDLVVYLSGIMTLTPGDLILTGTPEGVGLGQTPPRYLQAGDVVRVGIDGVATTTNRFVSRMVAAL